MNENEQDMTPAPRNVRADVDGILHELARMTGLGDRRELPGLQPVLDRTRGLLRRALDVVEGEAHRRGVDLNLAMRHPFEVVELVEAAIRSDQQALFTERNALLNVLRRVTGDDLRELDYVTFDGILRKVTEVVEVLHDQVRGMRQGGAGDLTLTMDDVMQLRDVAKECPELMPEGTTFAQAAVAGVKNGARVVADARRATLAEASLRSDLDYVRSHLATALGAGVEPDGRVVMLAGRRLHEWREACEAVLRKLGPWVGATTRAAQPSTLVDLAVLLRSVLRDQADAVRAHAVQSWEARGILSAALASAGVDVPDGLGLAQIAALVETRLAQAREARPDADNA